MARANNTDIAAAFAEIAQAIADADEVDGVLGRIGRLAVLTVDGCDDAGVTLRQKGRYRTAGQTSPRVVDVDRLQYALGEGPCVAAVDDRADYESPDLTGDERFPRFGPSAARLGVRSLLSFHLVDPGDRRVTFGSLNLYGERDHGFTDEDRTVGLVYAAHASIALSAARAAERRARSEADLREALASRDVIGQAKGILMERHRLSADDAFDRLRTVSQRLNVKLRSVAEAVADTGELPDVAR